MSFGQLTPNVVSPVQPGRTIRVCSETATGAGTFVYQFGIESDSLMLSLFVSSTAGDVQVDAYTITDTDNVTAKEFKVISFPLITAPTTNLLLKKSGNVLSRVRVVVTVTDACEFEIHARGVAAAEASVKVLGAAAAKASQKDVAPTTTLIIPAALSDRSGLIIKNNNALGGASIYIGFTAGEASLATGYPISAGESLGMDVASGVEVYGISTVGTTDVRLLESGN